LQIGYGKLAGEYDGRRVKVGIFDDGIQSDHPDLVANYAAELHVSIGGRKIDPGTGVHGTAVAGIIAAQGTSGGLGVAHGARIAGVNIFDGAAAFAFGTAVRQMATFDVTNNSWGAAGCYSDGPDERSGIGVDFESALTYAADRGRKGLGTIIVNAAGNDWTFDARDANTSAFNQDRHTVTVGAVTDAGMVSSYSNRSASLLVSAPSSGGSKGITTTDVGGYDGYDLGNATSGFGGTSAAAPVVSGVVALMLEANSRLGWRDVQEILAYSADHVGSPLKGRAKGDEAFRWTVNGAETFNNGGLHFSNDYGFGQVDAFTAVRMAEVWSLFGKAKVSKNEAEADAGGKVGRAIADGKSVAFTFKVTDPVELEHVDLALTLSHGDVSQLRVELMSPEKTRSVLLSPGGEQQRVSNWTWTLGSEAFRGETAKGTWTVKVTDTSKGAAGTLASFEFAGFGRKASKNDVYHFTDEFAALAAADRTRGTVKDKDGGTDWINLAGVAQNVFLNLKAGARSSADGTKLFSVAKGTKIENAVTGDGNDALHGNNLNNKLYGMRGDDRLVGGAGRDYLNGGAGSDTGDYRSSKGAVRLDLHSGKGSGGDAAGDKLRSVENLVGSRHADKLLGDAGANRLDGHLGNDLLTGRGGADAFVFSQRGFGRDTITDFTSGEDHLDLRALGLDWSQVAIASNSAGAVVSCAGGEIWLSGVSASLLTQDDFLF
jgi:subtilisin-like proprotein convertase family protein